MKCPQCSGDIKVSHTYSAGAGGKTQRGKCEVCRTIFCMTTIVEVVTKSGQGAYAKAQKLAREN